MRPGTFGLPDLQSYDSPNDRRRAGNANGLPGHGGQGPSPLGTEVVDCPEIRQ